MKCFQVFSRNNDINGNPYRLVVVYTIDEHDAKIAIAYEARSSSPNIVHTLYPMPQLPGVHVAAAEYRELKKAAKTVIAED